MDVENSSSDSKEGSDDNVSCEDHPLKDAGDSWCKELKPKLDKKAAVVRDISIMVDKKLKKIKQREAEKHKRQKMRRTEDTESKANLKAENDKTTKDIPISDDNIDEEKSQRRLLIEKRKRSFVFFDDIEKTSVSSKRDEFRELKILLAVLIGLILGGALFLVLHYCFQCSIGVAGGIAGGVTLVMCVMAVVSVHARCVVVLMSVGVFTGKGRVSVLCIITGVLVSGPVMNIAYNASEVVNTMACITELAYNQSLALQRSLEMPLREVEKQLQEMADGIKQEANVLGAELDVIKDGVVTVTDGVIQAKGALQGATMACKKTLHGTYQQCEVILGNTRRKCREELSKIDPSKAVRTLFDKLKPDGWFSRRKRNSALPAEVSANNRPRHKRGLEDVCNIFDIGDVCTGLTGTDLCKTVTFADGMINDAIMGVVNQVKRIRGFFSFDLTKTDVVGVQDDNSTRALRIANKIQTEVDEKIKAVGLFADVITKFLSVFLIVLILQGYCYKRRYLNSINFDNIYITDQMKNIDTFRLEKKLERVLPFRKEEEKCFVSSLSGRMLQSEFKFRIQDIALIFMHMIIVIIIIFMDYVFYYILVLTKNYTQGHTSGDSHLGLYVAGSGPVYEIFNTFVKGLNSQTVLSSVTDIDGVCERRPNIPDEKTVVVFILMYILTFILTLLKPYGLRLRPKIAAFYFPEQETARVNYLHRLIDVKRSKCWVDQKHMSRLSPDGHSENDLEGALHSNSLEFHTKRMKLCCIQCERIVSKAWMCDVSSCQTVLCRDCFEQYGEQCPVCTDATKEYYDDAV